MRVYKITKLALFATLLEAFVGRDTIMAAIGGDFQGAMNQVWDNLLAFGDQSEVLGKILKLAVFGGGVQLVSSAIGLSTSATVGDVTIGI